MSTKRLHPATSAQLLCVEDDPYLTDLLTYALGRDGYQVTIAYDGASALRLARTAPPDLVLLDLLLPDIDGFALCSQLRQVCAAPILIVSARDSHSASTKAMEYGAVGFIAKPFRLPLLCRRIRETLQAPADVRCPGV